jgi:two-component system CAI-1 autoinducer sensor kinase/phosphatase CqsS
VVSYVELMSSNAQTYESIWLRAVMAASGLPFIFGPLSKDPTSHRTQNWMAFVLWMQLPVMFSFMFIMNDGNAMRLTTLCSVILIYHQVTDWRLATVGLVTGLTLGGSLAMSMHTPLLAEPGVALWTLFITWAIGLFLSMSRANLHHEQLSQAVTTMAVMANEMRPAISTITLVGKALRSEANAASELRQAARLKSWGHRLERLSRSMNSTMSNQIANAHLLELGLPGNNELLQASVMVQELHEAYPYRSDRERECVQIVVRRDFNFTSSRSLFGEVLNNLMRNALRAVLATQRKLVAGDVLIEVGVFGGHGRITVSDRGIGMSRETLEHAFDAFFSTDRRAGHGLGLTFCRQIVQAASGTILAKSVQGFGATFTIEFAQIESPQSTLTQDDEGENPLDQWYSDVDIKV